MPRYRYNVNVVTAEIQAQRELRKRLDNIVRHYWK